MSIAAILITLGQNGHLMSNHARDKHLMFIYGVDHRDFVQYSSRPQEAHQMSLNLYDCSQTAAVCLLNPTYTPLLGTFLTILSTSDVALT